MDKLETTEDSNPKNRNNRRLSMGGMAICGLIIIIIALVNGDMDNRTMWLAVGAIFLIVGGGVSVNKGKK